jgi:DNA modification methylase
MAFANNGIKHHTPMKTNEIINSDVIDALKGLPDNSIDCCVTSPPYFGLRDYGVEGQIGLEKTPEEYIAKLTEVFRHVRRILKPEGTLWLNIGDSYNGYKGNSKREYCGSDYAGFRNQPTRPANFGLECKGLKEKDLIGITWLLAFALRSEGWYLRQDIIWHKPSVMPESVKDRCTKSHEYIFLLSKSKRYYFDCRSIAEPASTFDNIVRDRKTTKLNNTPGRTPMKGLLRNNYTTKNKRSVWTISAKPFKGAHFAVFPEQLVEPCIKAGCPEDGIVLDPFMGSGTTAVVARKLGRNFIGTELNPRFVELAKERLKKELGLFI